MADANRGDGSEPPIFLADTWGGGFLMLALGGAQGLPEPGAGENAPPVLTVARGGQASASGRLVVGEPRGLPAPRLPHASGPPNAWQEKAIGCRLVKGRGTRIPSVVAGLLAAPRKDRKERKGMGAFRVCKRFKALTLKSPRAFLSPLPRLPRPTIDSSTSKSPFRPDSSSACPAPFRLPLFLSSSPPLSLFTLSIPPAGPIARARYRSPPTRAAKSPSVTLPAAQARPTQ